MKSPGDYGDQIQVPAQMVDGMIAHSRFTYPEEACGLLAADSGGRLRMVYCLTNSDRSETAYTIEPTEHFRALQHAEAQGWTLVGTFHSHPQSPPFPSATDVRLAAEPDWVYFIVGLNDPPEVRGFRLREGTISELTMRIG